MGHSCIASMENIWLTWIGLCLPRSIAIWCGESWCSLVTAISAALMRHMGNGSRLEMGGFALYSCGLSMCIHVILTLGSYKWGFRSTAWVERKGRRQGEVKQKNLESCTSREYPSIQNRGWMFVHCDRVPPKLTKYKVRTVHSGRSHPQIALCLFMLIRNSMQTS